MLEVRIRICLAVSSKIGCFIGFWLLSHWQCTGSLADQNGLWLAKCWSWSENGQWLSAISSTNVILVYKRLLLCTYSEEIHTSYFKAFTVFSLISDLTGRNLTMFDKIPHHAWSFTWNVPNIGIIFHDANGVWILSCLHWRILPISDFQIALYKIISACA